MQVSLRELVGQVRDATESINSASAKIELGNQDLSSRTENTASNLQLEAGSTRELMNSVGQAAQASVRANQMASQATQIAQRGGAAVTQVVSTMQQINVSSRKISDIIGVMLVWLTGWFRVTGLIFYGVLCL